MPEASKGDGVGHEPAFAKDEVDRRAQEHFSSLRRKQLPLLPFHEPFPTRNSILTGNTRLVENNSKDDAVRRFHGGVFFSLSNAETRDTFRSCRRDECPPPSPL